MKIIHYTYLIIGLLFFFSCNEESNIPKIKDEAGLLIDISSSEGSLLGSPESGANIYDANVTITEAKLDLAINFNAGNTDNINKFEIVKTFSNSTITSDEIVVVETTTLPFIYSLNSIDNFLDGFNIEKSNLRIGDAFTFKIKVYQNDGDVYYYNSSDEITLNLNCSYNLEGTYTMTNSLSECSVSEIAIISKNPDGTWYIDTADGGLLQFCSENTTLPNPGSFSVECGGIVSPLETNGVEYCADFGIGCITGGNWNQDTGILILENSNDFFDWTASTYTSTYIRQ